MEQQIVGTKDTNIIETNFLITALVAYESEISDSSDRDKLIMGVLEKNKDFPFIQYIAMHARIIDVQPHSRSLTFYPDRKPVETHTVEVIFQLPPVKYTYFLLVFGETYNTLKHLRIR